MFSDILRMFSNVLKCSQVFAKVQVGRSIQSGGFAYNPILFYKMNAFSDVWGCSQLFSGCSQRCKLEDQYNLVELNWSNPSPCIQSNPTWWSQCNGRKLHVCNFLPRYTFSVQKGETVWKSTPPLVVAVLTIPDICHERHEYIRVNFFWPV